MRARHLLVGTILTALLWGRFEISAAISVTTERRENSEADSQFTFEKVPVPVKGDAGERGQIFLVDGVRDGNGGVANALVDGALPKNEDQPGRNFFFFGGNGGRILFDLGKVTEVRQVNTYSWHGGSRGPQVYRLFASDGTTPGFEAQPKSGTAPESVGWQAVARVDTRPKTGEAGGQYGVSIADSAGVLGQYRYLLFDILKTSETDPFGNTFYSEIDVIDATGGQPIAGETGPKVVKNVEADGGKYRISLETTEAPELTEWVDNELVPVVQQWYPKIVQAFPSEGFVAPAKVSVVFTPEYDGVAATGGARIKCASKWFRENLQGEAKGAVVHELVHVVQQYGLARKNNPRATANPGWLVEGVADYYRWFRFEASPRGADIDAQHLDRVRYNNSYRPTANFLNWVANKYGANIIPNLNAAMREGRYTPEIWKTSTGKLVQELNNDWKQDLAVKAGLVLAAPITPGLSHEESSAGWHSLFNGEDLDGWHNFKSNGVKPGWQVKDGVLVCADPHNAGDLCTDGKYQWFELQLDYNITPAGNSGIMFHVTDDGGAAWATGPEFQLEDNKEAKDSQRCGWLYALYQPPQDPQTGKPLDATKPAGEWNHVRLLVSPEKCVHEINGVKYLEYTLGSDDFKQRVAKSKFGAMPLFAKFESGYIALQGDHGSVSFRNIKIRALEPAK